MADIAIFRINYKSDFILTLQSDAGWLTPFCIKFWTGAPSQAYYAYYDGMSYTHCAPVDGEPTKLLVQFDDHHLPIGDLKFQIGYHFTVADFPTSVEDEVINQASVIIEVDDAPAQVMLDFNGETAPEIQFALPAYANEAQRIANEQARIAAEEQRISNEEARIAAEQERQQNEQQRISREQQRIEQEQQRVNAEAERVSDFASLKTESEAATAAANIAATLANEKAQLADDKAALAQAAATLANEKAQLAEDKANLAQQKADYAQTQGNYAKAQGDAAKTEAEAAHSLNEEVSHDEATRQQQEAARQQAESQRVTDFNAQMQQQQTAYTNAEAARDTAFDEAETERDAKVDAKVADITNLQAQIGYFVCDTAAATAAKTIATTGYVLGTGGNIRIKMTNANTVGNATLNINSTGAKPLFYEGARASSTNTWVADDILEIYYDGTNYQARNISPTFKTGEKVNNVGVDNEPTAGSENVVKSGGVWSLNRAFNVADTIYNGTPNNHGNGNRVRTSPIRVINGTHIILYTDRPLSAEGNHYVYSKYYKDKNGTVILNISTPSPNYRIQEVPYGAYTTEIGFGEVTAEGENITLRTSDFEGYNIYTIAFPSELFERISTLESSVDNIESLISTISTFLDNFEKEIRTGYVFDTIERSYVPSKNTSKYSSITFGLMKDHTYRFTFASESSFSGTQLSAKIINNDTSSKIKDLASNLLSNGSWDGSAESIVYTHSADRVGSVAVGSYGSTNLTIEGTGEIKVTIEDITISNLVNEDTPSEETSILDLNPAKEYLTKIKTLRRHDFNQSAPNDVTFPFILLHFSDIHGAEYNMQRIKEWWDEYSNYIDGVINTGDNVPTKWTQSIDYLINNSGDKILNVIGNHDVADPAVSSNMYNGNVPHTDIYAKFMSGLMDDTELGVIRPANASTYGYCFYYKDFTNRGNVQGQNLRVIVSDSVIQDRQWLTNAAHDRSYYEAELAWLEDVLADARANNLTVLIASHYGPQINTQIHDAKGFSFVDNSVSDNYGIHVAFHQKVQDFIDAGGKFVCWLCGHRHLDAFGTVDGYPQQIAITVTTAAYNVPRNIHYYQVDRAQDDKSADAFNMIGIDTEHKLLRILRIGCNYDGYFRPCDAITVDYSNLNNIKVWA